MRRGLAVACVLGLALFMGRRLVNPVYWKQLSSPSDPSFAWDPPYRQFLDAVVAATPPTATVAVIAPTGELYVAQAAYQLAPRRIVRTDSASEAQFVAIYLLTPAPAPPNGVVIPGGLLVRR